MNIESKREFIINCLFYAIVAAILFLGLKYVAGWFLPFIIGYCFAALANRLAARFTGRRKKPGKFTSVISALIIFVIIVGAVGGLVFFLSRQVGAFVQQYIVDGNMFESVKAAYESLSTKLPESFRGKLLDAAGGAVSAIASKLPDMVGSVVAKTPSALFATLISVIASLFMTAEYDKVREFLRGLVPKRYAHVSEAVSKVMRESVLRLLRAYALIMCITFAEVTLGLTLMGQTYAIGIAAITAVIDILPVFGLGFVLWPWAAYCFVMGDFKLGICLLVLYVVVQVVRQFIEPRLVGRSIGMHPLLTLTAMYVGIKVFGAIGLFVLPIIVLVIKNLNDNGTISVFRSAVKKEEKD
ncbi:MAG: sporulation integral membrane protein YtvI [Clostridia bacterium]|nr:sporulation integral membrane protein YtvI [Clostridia bacterium]